MLSEIKRAFAENKLAILIAAAILFISLILGYYFEPYLHSYLNPIVEELTRRVQSGDLSITFQDIFLNNLKVILAMFIGGLFFCFSALILAFNGFFVGYYVASTHDLVTVSWYIIPHGIFEFSSCILACAAGFVLFNFAYRFIKTTFNNDHNTILENLNDAYAENYDKLKQAIILFAISVVLMVIAGIIETYLTLHIAEFILS